MSSLGFEPRSLLRPFIGRKHRWRPIGGNGWGKPYFSSLDRNVRIFGFPFLAPPSSQPTNTFTLNTSSPDTLQWVTLCLRAAIIRITEEFSRVFQYHIVLSISFGLTIQIVAVQGSAKILECNCEELCKMHCIALARRGKLLDFKSSGKLWGFQLKHSFQRALTFEHYLWWWFLGFFQLCASTQYCNGSNHKWWMVLT